MPLFVFVDWRVMPINSNQHLPDWLMLLACSIFIAVFLFAAQHKERQRVPPPFQPQQSAWKLRALALAFGLFWLTFLGQTFDLAFIEANTELRFIVGRYAVLGIGAACCVLALNGLVFDWFGWVHHTFLRVREKIRARWTQHFSSR